MPTPVIVSPGGFVSLDSAATLVDTTNATAAAGTKIVAVLHWYNNVTLSSISGGGLTWTIVGQSAGATYHTAVCTADAPAGLASGTTITGTLSGVAFSRYIRLISVDGLELDTNTPVDASSFSGEITGVSDWSVSLTTANATDWMMGFDWTDFYSSGMTPSAGATELFENLNVDGGTEHFVYKALSATGSQSIGGTYASAAAKVNGAVAFKLAVPTDAGYGYVLQETGGNDRLALEDGSGFLLLDTTAADPIPPMIALPPRR